MPYKSLPGILEVDVQEERKLDDYREIPCKDLDLDCFALDGKIPFSDYRKCFNYAPQLGKCFFCQG